MHFPGSLIFTSCVEPLASSSASLSSALRSPPTSVPPAPNLTAWRAYKGQRLQTRGDRSTFSGDLARPRGNYRWSSFRTRLTVWGSQTNTEETIAKQPILKKNVVLILNIDDVLNLFLLSQH